MLRRVKQMQRCWMNERCAACKVLRRQRCGDYVCASVEDLGWGCLILISK